MKQMFMFCNNCLDKLFHSASWLVDSNRCTCIFLEEQVETMKLNRKTYWSNGLITYREMEIKNETELKQFNDEQARRVLNGPGINSVEVFDFRGRRYLCFDKPKPVLQGNNPVFMVQHAAAQMEANMFAAMMVNGTKEDLQRYCIENGMAMPSDNRIKLAKANHQMAQGLKDED